MLHVTNGDSVVHSFRDGGMPGTYLPWRDVLHDGAVPQRDTLEQLSEVRARELTRLGFGADGDVQAMRAGFAERDATLASFRDHEEVVLWFEHDLYDQLQLLQILDWFSWQDLGRTRLTMIQIGSHPEVTPFYGLGQLNGAQLMALLPTRNPINARQLQIGRDTWAAFTSPEPSALSPLVERSEADMPFLQTALVRWVEEFPSERDRLSRMEREILTVASEGAMKKGRLCSRVWQMEPWPWGDLSIFLRIDGLAAGPHPALDRDGDAVTLNGYGRRLLDGDRDAVAARTVDTWLGGAHVIIR